MHANDDEVFAEALRLWQAGEVAAARLRFEALIKNSPQNHEVRNSWGIFLIQQNLTAEASSQFAEAVKIDPLNASYRSNLASSLQALGKINEAILQFQEAVKLDPASPDTFYNLANAYTESKNYLLALESYDLALKYRPEWAKAYLNRGNVHDVLGSDKMALADFTEAIKLHPEEGGLYLNRAKILLRTGQLEQAKQDCLTGLKYSPNLQDLKLLLGRVLLGMGRPEAVIAELSAHREFKPSQVYLILGAAFFELGKIEQARQALEKSLEFDQANTEAMGILALYHLMIGKYRRAIYYCQKATDCGSDSVVIKQNQMLAHQFCGEFAEAIKLNATIPLAERSLGTDIYLKQSISDWSNLKNDQAALSLRLDHLASSAGIEDPWSIFSVCDDPRVLKQVAENFVSQKVLPLLHGQKFSPPVVPKQRQICIGYFSPDFKDHAVPHLARKLFQSHDRRHFRILAFSYGRAAPNDKTRAELRSIFDEFFEVEHLSDDEIVQLAKKEGVEIAVDLAGLTGEVRPSLLGRRPAPVQVNYLGFVGTTGTSWHDYIIADEVVIPPAHFTHFTEKVVHLPLYMPYDTDLGYNQAAPLRKNFRLPERGFIFCCLNNNFKITQEVFESWMRILQATPESVLWLRAPDVAVQGRLKAHAERCGVSSTRVIFAEPLAGTDEHLARYLLADLFLDTYPYNAHATAMDALWMGLPILTRMGPAMHTRVAASLLKSIGLDELVVSDVASYERLAINLAREPDSCRQFRKRIERVRSQGLLFPMEAYTRRLEKVYLRMSERCRQGLGPDHFTADV